MVYTERTDKCLSSTAKDNPSSKVQSPSKHTTGSGSAAGSGSSWSSQASNAEKWKYNSMVKNDRDKFNGMHFS
ncbi:uncharacterized protein Dana_GF14487 [Drosophila ananassae]|uniref:Uncharacterized protein n=1 Tax=Drosophila ananassae TaxID=7217 RepID=B3MKK9_DROAN|nr:uncharacterized protein LOC123256959 [Drosophila ananassae]EDV31562.1 uncharacterized protein Dana_GF14487 [Drosophila ananassae]